MRKFGLMFTMALLLGACHGAKYHYKSGKKYAQASMLKESVTSYKRAIDRKPNKVKYRIAMEESGSALLEELYTNYRFADGNDSASIYKFLDAEKWRNYLVSYMNTSRYEGFYDQDYRDQLGRFSSAEIRPCEQMDPYAPIRACAKKPC